MIRTSLFGICTNIAINFHFTTLPLINRHGPIGLYFLFFILTVFDIYSLPFYLNVYLLYVAHVSYIIKRISYGMVWYGRHREFFRNLQTYETWSYCSLDGVTWWLRILGFEIHFSRSSATIIVVNRSIHFHYVT